MHQKTESASVQPYTPERGPNQPMGQAAGGSARRHVMNESATRRGFLGGAALLLSGCATQSQRPLASLPGPIWEPLWPQDASPPATPPPSAPPTAGGVIPRTRWAKARPNPNRMDRMKPIRRITIHHDGMSPFTQTSMEAAANRLETIRRSHVKRRPQPFGDIGYHYAIDPAGRIWACRPVSWQGAHVRSQNQGNLGIVLLGNYDRQPVNPAQQRVIIDFVGAQMEARRIRSSALATHQELAATACPGRSLQTLMERARRGPLA